MTKKEAFIRLVQVGSLDDKDAEMFLLSAGVEFDTEFTGDLEELEPAELSCLLRLLTVSSESEGSWSQSRSLEGTKQRLLFLAKKFGRDDIIDSLKETPTIKKYDWGL
ncbi:DUF6706 family protein [Sphingobacterium thalpophilum]|uniref:DUF6706 family protein n=1 Tax=Sphingobacterium thalpophilum TaxID=259 RepID=UPI003D9873A7